MGAKVMNVADLFCGAGGTSTGCIEAVRMLGHDVDLTAINHWQIAVATHTANHPQARHLCASLDSLNPRDLYPDGQLDLLWASPECTHHSIARGGKPVNDQSRATAWCVARWAEALLPDVILVENVPEFRTWGPVLDRPIRWKGKRYKKGQPDPRRKGDIFQSWIRNLEAIGYTVDTRVLCAADYGDPTTRRRLFVQAVRGRRKICWPEPTHHRTGAGGLQPWVPARAIIDFSIPGESIFSRKRPLRPKTIRRIMAGLEKFGLRQFLVTTTHGNSGKPNSAQWNAHSITDPLGTITSASERALVQPFIIPTAHAGDGRGQLLDVPLSTVAGQRGDQALVEPFIVAMENKGSVRDIGLPLNTITTAKGGAHAVVEPFLIQMRGTNGQQVGHSGRDLSDPVGTISAGGIHHALIEPALLPQQSDGRLRPISEPAPTVATAGAIALIEPFLIKYFGTADGGQSIADPLATVTARDRHGLVLPEIQIDGQHYRLDIRFRMLQPHELAAAQGFLKDYRFTGTKTDAVKQIGNAVPRRLARALALAAVGQRTEIASIIGSAA